MLKNNLCSVLTQAGSFMEFTSGSQGGVSQCSCEGPAWSMGGEGGAPGQDVSAKICYCGTIVSDFPSSLERAKPFSCLLAASLALLKRGLRHVQLVFNLFFFFSKATVRAF